MKKTVLITGASRGIGRAAAEHFAGCGWNVAATMREPGAESAPAERDHLRHFALDVLDPEGIRRAVDRVLEAFGGIDVVVNNAGYAAYGPMEEADRDQIRRQFDVNVFGLLDVTRAVLPHFRARKAGVVVNISSVGGKIVTPLGSMYHGTKWAVEAISEALAYELGELGIRVRIVEPGGVKTDFAGSSLVIFDRSIDDYNPVVERTLKAMDNPNLAVNDPEDVARVVYRAATAKGRRLRYPAGMDARIMFLVRRLFGARGSMWTIRRSLGI